MWHKAEWMRHPMRLELTLAGLLVKLANHYTTRGAHIYTYIVIYEALCFHVAQGRMNEAPNETRTHSCRFANHYTTRGAHIYTYIWVCTSMHFRIFTQISVVCWWERVGQRKRVWEGNIWWGRVKWNFAIRISFSFYLYGSKRFILIWIKRSWFFGDKFCWLMMMIKVKIIITFF